MCLVFWTRYVRSSIPSIGRWMTGVIAPTRRSCVNSRFRAVHHRTYGGSGFGTPWTQVRRVPLAPRTLPATVILLARAQLIRWTIWGLARGLRCVNRETRDSVLSPDRRSKASDQNTPCFSTKHLSESLFGRRLGTLFFSRVRAHLLLFSASLKV